MPNAGHFHRKRKFHRSICLDSRNRPAISTPRHAKPAHESMRRESVWPGQNRNSESWLIQSFETTGQQCKVFSRSFCCLDERSFLNRRFSDSESQTDNGTLSLIEPAGFGIPCRRGSFRIRDEYQQGKVTSNNTHRSNNAAECRSKFKGIETTLVFRNHDYESMNLFCRFSNSVTGIPAECACCSDFAELRYQSDRYSTIRHDVGFRALAVRHGGLNGYQGQ